MLLNLSMSIVVRLLVVCVTKHRRKPSHSRTKRKSLIIIRVREALSRKLNNLKPLFSGSEEHCISKEFNGNALASKGKSCRPEGITAENQYACHALSVLKWAAKRFPPEHYLPSREKTHWKKQHFGVVCCLPTPFLHLNVFFHLVYFMYSFIWEVKFRF